MQKHRPKSGEQHCCSVFPMHTCFCRRDGQKSFKGSLRCGLLFKLKSRSQAEGWSSNASPAKRGLKYRTLRVTVLMGSFGQFAKITRNLMNVVTRNQLPKKYLSLISSLTQCQKAIPLFINMRSTCRLYSQPLGLIACSENKVGAEAAHLVCKAPAARGARKPNCPLAGTKEQRSFRKYF